MSKYRTEQVNVSDLDAKPLEGRDIGATVKRVKDGEPFHLWVDGRTMVIVGSVYVHAIRWLRDNEPEEFRKQFPQGTVLAKIRN